MADALVLLTAASIAGAVVWRLTAGYGPVPRLIRRRPRFDDTFEVTAAPRLATDATDTLAFQESGTARPPHRVWSALGLVVMIGVVSALGAAALWALGLLLNQAVVHRLAP